jgi:hypothetical protein
METIFGILNALGEGFSKEVVVNAVEMWLFHQKVKAFLEQHPGLSFTNEGRMPLNPAAPDYYPESECENGLDILAEAAAQRSVEEELAELAERVAETVLAQEETA